MTHFGHPAHIFAATHASFNNLIDPGALVCEGAKNGNHGRYCSFWGAYQDSYVPVRPCQALRALHSLEYDSSSDRAKAL
jgi:hypothetical protein